MPPVISTGTGWNLIMRLTHTQTAYLTGGLAALAALATGGMVTAPPEGPLRMSNMKIAEAASGGLAGFQVLDEKGARVGEVMGVTSNEDGQARWLRVELDAGGEVTLASFRAWLDARKQTVTLQLPEDLVIRRAAPETLSSLSV